MSVATPVVDTWDGLTRRIYLKQGITEFHPIDDLYKEYRYQRRTDESLRKWNSLLRADGNVNKGGGKATPRYVTLLEGTKIVPFDENAQLIVTGEAITDNPDVDSDIFYTDELVNPIKVYYAPSEAEIIYLGQTFSDTEAPIWDSTIGITNAYQNGALINISWGSASDANEVLYKVYITDIEAEMFTDGALLGAFDGNAISISSEADSVSTLRDVTYFIGVQAVDNFGNTTTNTNTLSVTYAGAEAAGALTVEQNDHLMALANYDDSILQAKIDEIIATLAAQGDTASIDEIESAFANIKIII